MAISDLIVHWVHVLDGGGMYHAPRYRDDPRRLITSCGRESDTAPMLEDAEHRGYRPCQRCYLTRVVAVACPCCGGTGRTVDLLRVGVRGDVTEGRDGR